VEKDISLFSRNKRTKDGMRVECKECRKKITKIYRDNNKEKIKSDRDKFIANNKDYFRNYAINNKESLKEYRKEYLEINKEKITESKKDYNKNNRTKSNEYLKKYRSENKEKIKEYYNNSKETRKKYYESNKDIIRIKRNEYFKKKKKDDKLFKLSCNVRTLVSLAINRKYVKYSKTTEIIGCSFEELKSRIESNFQDWMTWENYGLYNGELNYGWDIDHIIPLSYAKSEEDIISLNHYTNLQPLCSKVNRDIKRTSTEF